MYKRKKIRYLIAIIIFGVALPFTIYALILGFQKGVNADSLAGIPAVGIHIGALVLFIYLFFSDPLSMVHKLAKTNPVLAQQMIDEVNSAEEVCKNVMKSKSFYYFSGRNKILVVPIGEVKYLKVYKGYSRSVGFYKAAQIKSDYGNVKRVYLSVMGKSDSTSDEVMEQICRESNIVLSK